MKAIVYRAYGPPDVLRYEDVEKPAPRDGEVLIKIRAASVNPFDRHFMRGMPYLLRVGAGLRTPKLTRLGVDVAGEVEATGPNATRFKPGDAVFGACRGAFAEYACASETSLEGKPRGVSFEQAAAAPMAALTALQGLRDSGRVQRGHRVLVNGAAGGVGTFAVQIAKAFGAHVTGVCSTRNVSMVRAIGADSVVDYTADEFTSGAQRYDAILDCIGNHPLSACRRVLQPKGVYVLVGGPNRPFLGPFGRALAARVISPFVSQDFALLMATMRKPGDLATIRELLDAATIVPVIDRRYALQDVPDAIRYVEQGHARGKVVVTMGAET